MVLTKRYSYSLSNFSQNIEVRVETFNNEEAEVILSIISLSNIQISQFSLNDIFLLFGWWYCIYDL
jgi:hypothetical protein